MNKTIIIALLIIGIVASQMSFRDKIPATKAELGELLFFDPILSRDRTISCGSCHRPEYAFADTSALSKGVKGRTGTRNTPTAMNMVLRQAFFWDGRAKSLEEQALAPIENPDEMDLPLEQAIMRLKNDKNYSAYFKKLFSAEPDTSNLGEAIAAFERTLETSNSPFDNWKFGGDSTAVGDASKRGFILFNGKAKCVQCHFGADLTANEFRNVGLFNGKELNDSGRMVVTGKAADIGKFKTPSLRNIEMTAPYMHNGIAKTLDAVINFYNDPDKIIPNGINRDSLLSKPLGLTEQEKQDLKAFLVSLTDKRFKRSK